MFFTFYSFLKIFFSLLICTLPIIRLFNVKFEIALPVAISLIVFIFYFFGIFFNLEIGLNFLFFIIVFACLIILSNFLKNKKEFFKKIFTPGLLIYFIWLLITYIYYNEQPVSLHDDIHHWWKADINAFKLNSLPVGEKVSNIPHYLPGVSLFSYFILKINGGLNESVALFARSAWIYAIILYLAKYTQWKNYKFLLLFSLFGFLIPNIFNNSGGISFHSLGVDILHSIIFGYAVVLIFFDKFLGNFKFKILEVICVIFSLILIKDSGSFFVLIVISLLALKLFYLNQKFFFQYTPSFILKIFKLKFSDKQINFGFFKKNLQLLKISLVTLILTILSWQVLLLLNSTRSIYNLVYLRLLKQLFFFEIEFPSKIFDIFNLWIKALFTSNILQSKYLQVSFVVFYTIIVFFLLLNRKFLKKKLYFIFGISFFLILYLVLHFLTYIFIFSDGEGYALSSFHRYLLYFTSGIFFIIVAHLLENATLNKNFNYQISIIFLFVILIISNIENYKNKSFKKNSLIQIEEDYYQKKKALEEKFKNFANNESNFSIFYNEALNNLTTDNLDNINVDLLKNFTDLYQEITILKNSHLNFIISRNIEKFSKMINTKYNDAKGICIIEGVEGSGYGYNIEIGVRIAPIKTIRIIAYDSPTNEIKKWHEHILYDSLQKCSYAIVISPNKILINYYSKYFLPSVVDYGFYKVNSTSDNSNKKYFLSFVE
jgi:hypothetical protein